MARCEIRTAACLNVCASILMNKVLGSWSCMHCTCTVYGSCFLTEMIAFTDKLTLLSYSRSLLAPRNQHCGGKNAKRWGFNLWSSNPICDLMLATFIFTTHFSSLYASLPLPTLPVKRAFFGFPVTKGVAHRGHRLILPISLIRCVPYKATWDGWCCELLLNK